MPDSEETTPITKIRLRVPRGIKVEDLISKLEISYEEVEPTGEEFNQNYCCVDVALVGPVSTISDAGGGGDSGVGYA